MASNKETGHSKNVSTFEDLISFCAAYGATYNPTKAALKVPALTAQLTAASTTVQGETRGTKYETRGTKYETRGTKYKTRDTKYETPDTKYGTPDTKYKTRDTTYKTRDVKRHFGPPRAISRGASPGG